MCGYGGLPGPRIMVVNDSFEFDLFWFIPGWSRLVLFFDWSLVVAGGIGFVSLLCLGRFRVC